MTSQWNRRDILRGLTVVSTTAFIPARRERALIAWDPAIEIQITSVSPHTLRLSFLPTAEARIPLNGSLVTGILENL